jgi:hypothetical protein
MPPADLDKLSAYLTHAFEGHDPCVSRWRRQISNILHLTLPEFFDHHAAQGCRSRIVRASAPCNGQGGPPWNR